MITGDVFEQPGNNRLEQMCDPVDQAGVFQDSGDPHPDRDDAKEIKRDLHGRFCAIEDRFGERLQVAGKNGEDDTYADHDQPEYVHGFLPGKDIFLITSCFLSVSSSTLAPIGKVILFATWPM